MFVTMIRINYKKTKHIFNSLSRDGVDGVINFEGKGHIVILVQTKGSSPRARNRFNQVVEAKRFKGVFLCRKVC